MITIAQINFIRENTNVAKKLRTVFALFGTDVEIFKTGIRSAFQFRNEDEKIVIEMVEERNFQNIGRARKEKLDLVDLRALEDDVLFFCNFLKNYLSDEDFKIYEEKIYKELRVEEIRTRYGYKI